ncbi:hypothetical protein FNF27_06778 [Cafeteria roenbergensis]|uniref:Ribosomal protein S16 n=2 Tax=Cafeteria roenbergensis TaxID=33653 RepID=A0A5A8CM84_CAFRO|nr:hypothetical protein FNF29_03015 [Cafeteria roenbergensis]KAA0163506.1 hypothetical protein FNF31_02900 [Cafeteria roenbergensis]KAA0165903.1 hypothetical protein FNF28_03285 [Cafeteria roenbergensis]KAA0170025.1 hypothetical protein FNF27_06778 [Cafeteria roenbergensis]|eukprot:KAA0153627.1 hypothetical protein FNF29_03015 [Cafeteria roenbergensis]
MPTRLRLARFGCKRRPFYRIVATDSRKWRDGKPTEYVGTYDPMPRKSDGFKEIRLKVDRVKYWLSTGAQPTETVAKLLWRAGLAPPPPIAFTTKRHIKRSEREFHTSTGAGAGERAPPTVLVAPAAGIALSSRAGVAGARTAGVVMRASLSVAPGRGLSTAAAWEAGERA